VKKGKAKKTQKSAPIPKTPTDKDGITTLVGDSFDDVVLNPELDVFVDFWGPDCNHCNDLDPIWKAVATRIKKNKQQKFVTIAKINTAENDHPEEIVMVPKIVLYPAVKADQKMRKKFVYTGARDLEQIMAFLEQNGKHFADPEDDEL